MLEIARINSELSKKDKNNWINCLYGNIIILLRQNVFPNAQFWFSSGQLGNWMPRQGRIEIKFRIWD